MGENESSTVKPIAPFKLYNKNKQEITDIDQLENEYNDFKIKKKHTILEKRAEGLEKEKENNEKKQKIEVETESEIKKNIMKNITNSNIKRVRAELVNETKEERTKMYNLFAVHQVKWGDTVQIEFENKDTKIIVLEKEQTSEKNQTFEENAMIRPISSAEIEKAADSLMINRVNEEGVKGILDDWKEGYPRAQILEGRPYNGKYYLKLISNENLSKGDYFQATSSQDSNIGTHFETPKIFQFEKFKKDKIVLNGYGDKINYKLMGEDGLISISSRKTFKEKHAQKMKKKKGEQMEAMREEIITDETKKEVFNEFVKKLFKLEFENGTLKKVKNDYKIENDTFVGGMATKPLTKSDRILAAASIPVFSAAAIVVPAILGITMASSLVLGYGAVGAIVLSTFLVLDKYYGYKKSKSKFNEKYFILDKDNFIKYLYENEIQEKHINEIKLLKSEFIFIIRDDKNKLQEEIKKAAKNPKMDIQIFNKIIKEDKKIREIINDTVTNQLEKLKEKGKKEKENNEKLTAMYGDDSKTLEQSVTKLSDKYDIDFGDLEGTIIPNDGDFKLSLEKKPPNDKIVKFKIDDESNLYCKSNDFNSKKILPIPTKKLTESTHKILEERLAQLEKLKKIKESNKKKEGEEYILHEPKPPIPKDKKPFIITTKDGQKILVKPEEYSSLTNEIELYFYPKENFHKLDEGHIKKEIQDEYDKNKKEVSDHNNDLWFPYTYKTKNKKKPDKRNVYYKGRIIEDFSFTEENSAIFLKNQEGGFPGWGRSKPKKILYIL